MTDGRNRCAAAVRNAAHHTGGGWGFQETSLLKVFAAHLLMQIRHNLVVPEKPFFRRGRCVVNAAHHVEVDENTGFFGMRRARLSLAVAGMAVSAAVGAALWPHAYNAGAILAAQDEP